MTFERISADEATCTEVYSDGVTLITVVHPAHRHSGFPLQITANAVIEKFDDEHGIPEATDEPELTNAHVEGEDVPPATHAEFEKLGQ